MKKILILLVFIVGLSTVKAQGIDLGIKGGFTFSKLSSLDDVKNVKNKTGYFFGVFGALKVNDTWGIQPEILYSKQTIEIGKDAKFKTSDIKIPILLKYYLLDIINIQLGPEFRFASDKLTGVDTQIKDSFESKSFKTGIIGGIGLELPLGLRADARYSYDLSKSVTIDKKDGRNSVFTLSVGWTFL